MFYSQRYRVFISVCCLWLCVKAPAFCFQSAEDRTAREEEITVIDVSGETHQGILKSISKDRLKIENQGITDFNLSELMMLSYPQRKSDFAHKASLLLLENGDRLLIGPAKMTEDHLLAQWAQRPDTPVIRVPLETIRGFIPDVPRDEPARKRILQKLLEPGQKNDVLILTNGNRVPGELLDIDFSELSIKGPLGKTTVDLSGVLAVAFNPELISFPETSGTRILLTLTDGSRITANTIEMIPQSALSVEAACGAELTVPASQIAAMRFLGGRVMALSDLKPAEYEFTPYLSTRRSLEQDRNVSGGELRLRGTAYPKGLGMHSKSRVTYDLNERFSRFQAVIGIDDSAEGGGSAAFAVEVDGERRFTSEPLTGMSPPLSIEPIDVRGKKKLTLIVDYGPRGDIRDHANWCDAVLVK